MKLTRISEKIGGSIGNLTGTIVSRTQSSAFRIFIYVMAYVSAFLLPVVILEMLAMKSTTTLQHMYMLPLALFTFIPAILWHWPLSWFSVGFAVGTQMMVSLIWASIQAAIGHALSIAASIILIPFLVFAKFVIMILAIITDNATTPNFPKTISDIIALRVNNCDGSIPAFKVKDYYLLSQLKTLIDGIANTKVPGGGTGIPKTDIKVPNHVNDIPGISQMFDSINAIFNTTFPPTEAFTPMIAITNAMFNGIGGDYSGMELMNEALYIKRLQFNSNGTLVHKDNGFFSNLFDTIVGKFLGCG